MTHEFAHYNLLSQKHFFNDEKPTDIFAIASGSGSYWLEAQNWKRYFTTEQLSYLNKEEGLFALGCCYAVCSLDIDFKVLPKPMAHISLFIDQKN